MARDELKRFVESIDTEPVWEACGVHEMTQILSNGYRVRFEIRSPRNYRRKKSSASAGHHRE